MNKIKEFCKKMRNAAQGIGDDTFFFATVIFAIMVEVTVLIYFQKPIEQFVANEKVTQAAYGAATAQVRVDPTATPVPIQITNWRIFVTQRNTEW